MRITTSAVIAALIFASAGVVSLAAAAPQPYGQCENCGVGVGPLNANLPPNLRLDVGQRHKAWVLNGNMRGALLASVGQGQKGWLLNVRDSRSILNGDMSGVLHATLGDGRRAYILNVRAARTQ